MKMTDMTAVERLKNGECIKGTLVRMIRTPAVSLVAKAAGLDFLLFDMEHGSFSFETLTDIAAASRAAGVGIFCRVPELRKSYISRALDSGIEGVMVPMVSTKEQAEAFVKLAKYQPIGDRGLGSNGGLSDYAGMQGLKTQDFMDRQNTLSLAIAQIETAEAIENVDEIAAVKGIDVLLVGPNDLSISMGIPGEYDNPEFLAAIEKVCKAAERNHIAFSVHGPMKLQAHWQKRVQMQMFSMDIDALTNGFRNIRKELDALD